MSQSKHGRGKYSLQKKEYFSIRKFKFGAASALIGVGMFVSGGVLAEEQTQASTPVAIVATTPTDNPTASSEQAPTSPVFLLLTQQLRLT